MVLECQFEQIETTPKVGKGRGEDYVYTVCIHGVGQQTSETYCSPDVELLCISFRPRYLPREFGQVTLIAVYVPPSENDARAAEAITDCAQRIEAAHPDSPLFIMGDFNSCQPSKSLTTFHQYVKCDTQGNKTIDLCYGNVRNAYKAK